MALRNGKDRTECTNSPIVRQDKNRSVKSTRARQFDWLLGYGREHCLSLGVRLPLNRMVVERFIFVRKQPDNHSLPTRDLCRSLMKEICSIWERAGIPTKPEKNIIDQLVELHKHWCKIKKINIGARNNERNLNIINNFEAVLNELCDVSPLDVMERLRASRNEFWEEDYQFLLGQRKFPQIGMMNGTDRKSLNRLKRVCERSDLTASRSKKKNGIPDADNEQYEDDQLDKLEENEDCNYEKEDSEFALPQHHQPPKPSRVMVQIPTKNLLMLTGEVADRTQLSIRSQLAMTATIVKAGGASLNDFTLSTTSAWRQRNEQRVTTANNIKQNWANLRLLSFIGIPSY
jgi:hypothetical protein